MPADGVLDPGVLDPGGRHPDTGRLEARSAARVLVTYLPHAEVAHPMVVEGRTVLEAGSPVVWFTFPGTWHDIGRFHSPDGTFTGYYANILTPVKLEEAKGPGGDVWRTTDLFLDVFLTPGGEAYLLDREELDEAVERGWVEPAAAARAEAEAERLLRGARSGAWPPPVVHDWPVARARAVATSGTSSGGTSRAAQAGDGRCKGEAPPAGAQLERAERSGSEE